MTATQQMQFRIPAIHVTASVLDLPDRIGRLLHRDTKRTSALITRSHSTPRDEVAKTRGQHGPQNVKGEDESAALWRHQVRVRLME